MIDLCCIWGAHWPRPGEKANELHDIWIRWFSCPVERAIHSARLEWWQRR